MLKLTALLDQIQVTKFDIWTFDGQACFWLIIRRGAKSCDRDCAIHSQKKPFYPSYRQFMQFLCIFMLFFFIRTCFFVLIFLRQKVHAC